MGLILDGRDVRMKTEVVDYLQHGFTWPIGSHGVKLRKEKPRQIVVHITGGEGGGRQVFTTLSNRGYSVHFVIDRGGMIWQYLDPARAVAAHTGHLNDASIGIEVANSGWPVASNPYSRPLTERWVHIVDADKRYVRTKTTVGLGLFPVQIASLKELVRMLCVTLAVPYQRADMRPYVPVAERQELRGILGHCQVTLSHGDPTLDALQIWPEAS